MKFQGKIGWWFWLVMLGGEALLIALFFETGSKIIIIGSFLFYNLLFYHLFSAIMWKLQRINLS